uniref:Uncharacterized protein n=1 Tax=Lepeophtheirus salmonis TaxID=72036 RepID=A0A0K2TBG2_LEPSM
MKKTGVAFEIEVQEGNERRCEAPCFGITVDNRTRHLAIRP